MEKNNLFLKMKAFVYDLNSNIDEYNFFLQNNEDQLLKEDPILFIGLKTDYYIQREEFEQGLNVISYYQRANYISMEVEDFLRELKDEILKELKSNNKSDYSDEKLKEDLLSLNENKTYNALRELSNKNVYKFLDVIKEFLKINKNEKMQKLLLIILMEQHVNNEYEFKFDTQKIKLNPSKLTYPFEQELYKNIISIIEKENKDPSVINRKEEIVKIIFVQAFPFNPFDNISLQDIYQYINYLDNETIGKDNNIILDKNILNKLRNYLLK